MRAALQFGGHLAELCCKFAQCQPRVDLWGLFREFQALFGILSVSALQRSKLGNARPGAIVPLSDLQLPCTTVSVSILDDPKHWQERAEEARSIAEQLPDPESRRMLIRIADDYERFAADARRRMMGPAARSRSARHRCICYRRSADRQRRELPNIICVYEVARVF
jgi:hypothetical protein